MNRFLKTYNTKITILLFLAVLLSVVVMRSFDARLTNDVCTGGIVSFELTQDLSESERILDSWDDHAKLNASLSMGYDFLFLLLYSSFIALLIFNINERLWENRAFHKVGRLLIFLIFCAAVFDAVENYALIKLLLNDLSQT